MNNEKTPALVQLVALLGLLGGLVAILFSIPLFSLITTSATGIISFILNIILVIGSYGVRIMKKWGLYLFTLSLGYGLIMRITNGLPGSLTATLFVIEVLMLVYLWAIYRKFE